MRHANFLKHVAWLNEINMTMGMINTGAAANRWECIELGFVRVWRRTVNEQGGRRKNHEIGVSEFSSGERPPGTVVCSKKGVDDTV